MFHLKETLAAYQARDPAARSKLEVLLLYPGVHATMYHQAAHFCYCHNLKFLARTISQWSRFWTGIEIHPGAKIGRRLVIDHGMGIVIGETTVIGRNVKLYQGVTLGARFVEKELTGVKRHPTIEDNVIIYAGSTILGGDTVVGHDTVIGGNVWLTESVPPHSTVYHKPEIIIKGK